MKEIDFNVRSISNGLILTITDTVLGKRELFFGNVDTLLEKMKVEIVHLH